MSEGDALHDENPVHDAFASDDPVPPISAAGLINDTESERKSLLGRKKRNRRSVDSSPDSIVCCGMEEPVWKCFFGGCLVLQVLILTLAALAIAIVLVVEYIINRNTPTPLSFSFDAKPDTTLQHLIAPHAPSSRRISSSAPPYWIGGDSAASVSLSFPDGNTQSALFMGDSLFGQINLTTHERIPVHPANETIMINNLVGLVSTPISSTSRYSFHNPWNGSMPLSLFLPLSNKSIHLWAMQAIVIDSAEPSTKELFIFSPRVVDVPQHLVLDGFGVVRCLNITSASDPVRDWQCEYSDIAPRKQNRLIEFGYVGNYIHKGFVYMLGIHNVKLQMSPILCRLRVDHLRVLKWDSVEFYDTAKGSWVTDEKDVEGGLVGMPRTTETSLSYSTKLDRFYACVIPNVTESFGIQFYSSTELTGPYDSTHVYDIPSPFSTTKNVIAYGVKSHPELATNDDELVLSYNTNAWPPSKFFDLFYEPALKDLVIPQFLRVKIKIENNGPL